MASGALNPSLAISLVVGGFSFPLNSAALYVVLYVVLYVALPVLLVWVGAVSMALLIRALWHIVAR